MEYSKDIALGVKYFNVEDNVEVKIQKGNKENKVNKSCTKISKQSKKGNKINKKEVKKKNIVLKFMNEHKFITSISITCLALIMFDCMLVYSFIDLLQRL